MSHNGVPEGKFTETIYTMIKEQKYPEAIKILDIELQSFPRSRAALSLLGHTDLTHDDFRSLLAEPYFVPSGTPVFRQLQYFQENRRRLGLIVNEYGDMPGLVTLEDIIEEIVKQDATARFVADNLYRYFVSDEPNESGIKDLMNVYFEYDYEIRPMLRHIFNSDEFKNAAYEKVRWPVDHVVNIVNISGRHTDPYEGGIK